MNEIKRLKNMRKKANQIIKRGSPPDLSTKERVEQANKYEAAQWALSLTQHLGRHTAWGRAEQGALQYAEGQILE